MKILEAIEELQKLMDEHGNLEVYMEDDSYGPTITAGIDMIRFQTRNGEVKKIALVN